MTIRETDKAYLAGLIDADGSIHITNQPMLCIKVAAVSELYLRRWRDKTGYGNAYLMVSKCPEHPQGAYQWMIQGKEAADFLGIIFPYLDLKKKQAELAFQFAETITFPGRRLSTQTRQLRETLRLSMKALNNYEDKEPEQIFSEMHQKDLDKLSEWQGENSHPYLVEREENEG